MDTVRLSDVFWISLAAFAGFELALAANYLFLKFLLRAMYFAFKRENEPPSRQGAKNLVSW